MATRTLNPNLDQKLVNVTGNGGSTPISPKLVDAADGTYAIGTADGGYAWVRVGPGTQTVLATNERCRWVQIHARVQHEGTDIGHIEYVSLVPRNPDSVPKVNPDRWYYGSGAGFREHDSQKWTKTPDAKEWTNRIFDNLQIEAIWRASVNDKFVRLVELRMVYDVCTQPSVTGVTVTNTTTTRPTVTATYASTDGYAQKRYQVKVFSPAQYNAAGFSPDTSTPVWTSGEVHSNQFGPAIIGTDLVGGVSYRAYARGSYDFNGGDYWSAWDFAAFTIATEPPPAPLLTATVDLVLQRVLLATQGRVNMLTADDADFEGSIGNWITGAFASSTVRSTAFARHGSASMAVTGNGGGATWVRNHGGALKPGLIPVRKGQQVTLGGYARAGSTTRSWKPVLRWYDTAKSDAANLQADGAFTAAPSGGWTALTPLVAPAPFDGYAAVQVEASTTLANGEVHYFDQVQAVPGATLPAWTPGGYTPTATTAVDYWDVATGRVNQARPEVAAGSTSRTTVPGYVVPTAADYLIPDPTTALAGGSGVLWIPSATGSRLDIGYQRGAWAIDYALPAPPGTVLVASVWAKASANGNYTAAAEIADGVGVAVGGPLGTATWALTTAWQRFSIAVTGPAGGIFGQLGILNATGGTGQSVWVDQFQWEIRPAGSSTVPSAWAAGEGTAPAWQPVRGFSAVTPPASQAWTESDFEIPTGRARIYRARTNVALDLANLASADVAGSYAHFWIEPDGRWRLVDIHRPENSVVAFVYGDQGLDETIDPEQVELHPAGADYAVVYSDFVGGYRSALPVVGFGEQEWATLKRFVETDDIWLLKLPEGGGRYIRIGQRQVNRSGPVGGITRRLTLPYVQTARPPDGT
jgi:hypothetical protein